MTDEEYDIQFGRNRGEYIICAAIWFNDERVHVHQPRNVRKGFVICGRRHHNCFTTASLIHGESFIKEYSETKRTAVQGFLTSHDRFIEREEAAKVALDRGQIIKQTKILFSEDIY